MALRALLVMALLAGLSLPAQAGSRAPAPLLAAAPPAPAAVTACRGLSATFLQPLRKHLAWDEARWTRLFADLREARVGTLILQWSQLGGFSVLDPAAGPRPGPALGRILALAHAHGIDVRLGLVFDPAWWQRLKAPPRLLAVHLDAQLLRTAALVERLAPYTLHPAFAGWYVTEEIDDLNWREPVRQALLARYLATVTATLRHATPGASIAISGFVGGHGSAQEFAALWSGLVRAGGFDLVLLQDGAGAHKHDPAFIAAYAAALRHEVEAAGSRLAMVVELFDQTGGAPVDQGPYRAGPAAFPQVLERLIAAGKQAPDLVGFAMPTYMSSVAGEAAATLRRDYVRWLSQGCADRP